MSFFDNLFKIENKKVITGLTTELKAIYVNNYYQQFNQAVLIVTSSLYEAQMFYQTLLNYNPEALIFPMDDFLTSEALAISPELEITRLETLNELIVNSKRIVVTNLMGLLRFLPKKNIFENSIINIKIGDCLRINDLSLKLYNIGYKNEIIVNKTGEFAKRGYILDIYPINEKNPVRIEFWDEIIESIRYFDVNSQLKIDDIEAISINPNSEFITEEEVSEERKKQKYLNAYGKVVSLCDYLSAPIVFYNSYMQIETNYKLLSEEIIDYNESLGLPLSFRYMHSFTDFNNQKIVYFDDFKSYIDKNYVDEYQSKALDSFGGDFSKINDQLVTYLNEGKTVIICLDDRYKVQKLNDLLDNKKVVITESRQIIDNHINIIIKNINYGFIYDKYVVISEKDLYNKKNNYSSYKTKFNYGTKIRDIGKLNVGDYIVHFAHGIGRYLGIETLTKNNLMKDYLAIQYAGNDKLYIPVEKLELISKYSNSDASVPKINRLGSLEWQKTKLRVRNKIASIARELLQLYAARKMSSGFPHLIDTQEQVDFEKEFKYEETPDQLKVIDEIKQDMESGVAMDRLLCGDVGYGKTEVAFRAAFKAIMSGKQVAFLCPTTILSQQHYDNALERFGNFPVNIAILNRFVTAKTLTKTLKAIKEGQIDLLIGTHRILSDDIIYKDLGLLIIDEEQRFGVKHKEKIKSYKNNLDVLTLSATPIPRTLQMSLAGLRSLSMIDTPPVNRYPVQTYVLAENNHIIKEVIYKELSRGGQVFILYNRVEKMEKKLAELTKLVPEAKVVCAHGQMNKLQLEKVMQKFINNEYNVLLCTTIIEIGIDIPTVNTLIILDADNFGLSQLYQIRGRVGRSDKIAYCYLMYNNSKILSEIAVKRLSSIKEFTELGSGFSIAMRDLSIRGAGDILGSEQAGFMDSVGIELYLEMLNEEVNRLNGNDIADRELDIDRQPLLDVATSIPDTLVFEEELKIEIHKKINKITNYVDLVSTKKEFEDRFGYIPDSLEIYMHEEWFEKLAKELEIKDVIQTNNFIKIRINKKLTKLINGEKMFFMASEFIRKFQFTEKNDQLIITLPISNLDKHFIYYLIDLLKIIKESII